MKRTTLERARQLAKRPYKVVIAKDKWSTSRKPVYVATYAEFPGCMASGDTEAEARVAVQALLPEHIAEFLESGVTIPEPKEVAA